MGNRAKILDSIRVKSKVKSAVIDNSGKKWLFLPIETKVRELDAKLLLTYYALQENYNVVLGLSEMVEIALEYLPNGIFLDKGYTDHNKWRRFKNAHDNGHLSVNLEEEGFPLTEKELYLKKHVNPQSLHIIDYEFCWGEVQKNTLINAYPFVKEKCVITGNPRFDLLRKKYRNLFDDKVKEIKDKYGPFILVNTRFPLYTKTVNDDGSINQGAFERLGKIYGASYQNKMVTEYKKFIIMVKKLSERYPNLNIIVRPHPSDNFNVYNKDLQGYKNISIVHTGNVINWILASKLVIHSSCTTGVESFLLEKPVISYISTKEDKYDLPNELSIKAYNLNQIFQFIDHDLENYVFTKNKFDEDKKMGLLSKSAVVKGNFAYQNILEQLQKLSVSKDPTKNEINLNSELVGKLDNEINKKVYKENTIVKQKFPGLQAIEIHEIFNKLDKIENRKTNIKIRKLHEKLFEIAIE